MSQPRKLSKWRRPMVEVLEDRTVPYASTYTGPAIIIPDDATVVTSTITVPDTFDVQDLQVELDLDHRRLTDLQVTLKHGAGSAPLAASGGAQDVNTFDGQAAAGNWLVEIRDNVNGVSGRLVSWTLTFKAPDLTVAGVSATATPAAGNVTVNATVTVSNVGLLVTPTPPVVILELVENAADVAGTQVASSTLTAPLAAGASQNVTFSNVTVTAAQLLAFNRPKLRARVDPGNLIRDEYEETNNSSGVLFTFEPDLKEGAITATFGSQAANGDVTLNVSHTVQNVGTLPATATVVYILIDGAGAQIGADLTPTFAVPVINPGLTSTALTGTLTVPASRLRGNDVVFLSYRIDTGGAVPDKVPADNDPREQIFAFRPDLTVTGAVTTGTPSAGDVVFATVNVTAANQGHGDAGANVTVILELVNDLADLAGTQIATRTVNKNLLEVNETTNVAFSNVTVTAAQLLTFTTPRLRARIDPANAIPNELDETNNSSGALFTFEPDLKEGAITATFASQAANGNVTLNVSHTVQNSGTLPATATVVYILIDGAGAQIGADLTPTFAVPAINPGLTSTVLTGTVTVAAADLRGRAAVFLSYRIDTGGAVPDKVPADNDPREQIFAFRPDLTVTGAVTIGTPTAGDVVFATVNVTATNQGRLDATDDVRVILELVNDVNDAVGTEVATVTVLSSDLELGERKNLTFSNLTVTAAQLLAFTTPKLRARIDPDNDVPNEVSETNNSSGALFTFEPDLKEGAITATFVSQAANGNVTLNVSHTVQNSGTLPATATVVYILIDGAGAQIGADLTPTFAVPVINPGLTSTALTGTLTVPASRLRGNDVVFLSYRIDTGGAVPDKVPADNDPREQIFAFRPDLTVTGAVTTGTPTAGDVVFGTVNVTAANQGHGDAGANVTVILELVNDLADLAGTLIATRTVNKNLLEVNENTNVAFSNVTVTAAQLAGRTSAILRARIDPANAILNELDETNNTSGGLFTFRPDLAIGTNTAAIASRAANNDVTLNVSHSVRNVGTLPAGATGVYFLVDAGGTQLGADLTPTFALGTVGAGVTTTVQNETIVVPATSLNMRTQTFLAFRVDIGGGLTDVNLANNRTNTVFEFLPDLVVTSLTINVTPQADGTLQVSYTAVVDNVGDAQAGAFDFNLDLIRSSNGLPVALGSLLTSSVTSLDGRTTTTIIKTATLTAAALDGVGNATFRGRVDSGNAVREYREDNNLSAQSRAVAPDLVAGTFAVTGFTWVGDDLRLTVNYTVSNTGTLPVRNANVSFALVDLAQGGLAFPDRAVAANFPIDLAILQSVTRTETITIPRADLAGLTKALLSGTITTPAGVTDVNLANNTAARFYEFLPDLQVTSFDLRDFDLVAGVPQFTVTYALFNGGTLDATPFTVATVLSLDAVVDAADESFFVVDFAGLVANSASGPQTRDVTLSGDRWTRRLEVPRGFVGLRVNRDPSAAVPLPVAERDVLSNFSADTFSVFADDEVAGAPALVNVVTGLLGGLDSAGDVDSYQFTLAQDGVWTAELAARNGPLLARLTLLGPAGEELLSREGVGETDGLATLPLHLSAGTYRLLVRAAAAPGAGNRYQVFTTFTPGPSPVPAPPSSLLSAGVGPASLHTAFVNDDEAVDLIAFNAGSGDFSIFLGNRDGTFAAERRVGLGGPAAPTSVFVADLNRDGRADLAAVSGNAITIAFGLSNGDFRLIQTVTGPAGAPFQHVAGGVFGSRAFLAAIDPATGRAHVFMQDATGQFVAAGDFAAASGQVVVGDFDIDGVPDLAVLNPPPTPGVAVLFGRVNADGLLAFDSRVDVPLPAAPLALRVRPGGAFLNIVLAAPAPAMELFFFGRFPITRALALPVADPALAFTTGMSGSDDDAIFLSIHQGAGGPEVVQPITDVFVINLGGGVLFEVPFASVARTPLPAGFRAPVASDFNGDGYADLAHLVTASNTVRVLLGTPRGTLREVSTEVPVPVASTAHPLDLDSDGKPDLLVYVDAHGGLYGRSLRHDTVNPKFQALDVTRLLPATVRDVAVVNVAGVPRLAVTSLMPTQAIRRGLTTDPVPSYNVDIFAVTLAGGVPVLTLIQRLGSTTGPAQVVAADLIGDGNDDLALLDTQSGRLSVFFQLFGLFFAGPAFDLNNEAVDLTVVDVDGQNGNDLALVGKRSGDVTLFRNLGGGAFERLRYAAGTGPFAVAALPGSATREVFSTQDDSALVAVDLDGALDGNAQPDLLVLDRVNRQLVLLRPNGAGGMLPPEFIPLAHGADAVAAGDLNGDGRVDVIVLDAQSQAVRVYLASGGAGTATLTNPLASVVSNIGDARAVALKDVNGDGKLDLLVTGTTRDLLVLLGKGDGTFEAPSLTDNQPNRNRTLAFFNDLAKPTLINNQPAVDYLVALDFATETVEVLVRDPANAARFVGEAVIATNGLLARSRGELDWADLNRDGRKDAIFANKANNTIEIYHTNAVGQLPLTPDSVYVVGTGPDRVQHADLNGDRVLDLIVANRYSRDVSILFGDLQPAAPPRLWVGTVGPRVLTDSPQVFVQDVASGGPADGQPDLVFRDGADTVVVPGRGFGFFADQPDRQRPGGGRSIDILSAEVPADAVFISLRNAANTGNRTGLELPVEAAMLLLPPGSFDGPPRFQDTGDRPFQSEFNVSQAPQGFGGGGQDTTARVETVSFSAVLAPSPDFGRLSLEGLSDHGGALLDEALGENLVGRTQAVVASLLRGGDATELIVSLLADAAVGGDDEDVPDRDTLSLFELARLLTQELGRQPAEGEARRLVDKIGPQEDPPTTTDLPRLMNFLSGVDETLDRIKAEPKTPSKTPLSLDRPIDFFLAPDDLWPVGEADVVGEVFSQSPAWIAPPTPTPVASEPLLTPLLTAAVFAALHGPCLRYSKKDNPASS